MNNVFFFTGDNSIELQEKLNFWKQEFIKKHSDSNLETYDDLQQKQLPEVLNALESVPFLADKRMVIIKGFPLPADAKRKIEAESLEEVLKQLPETTLAIFVSPNPDKRSRFYKWLNTHAKKEEFIAPKGRDMLNWVQKKFQRYQKSISPLAAEALVFYCGDDLNLISHEIEKLSLLESSSFDEKAIERFVTPNPEARIFKVLDMVGKSSPQRLLKEFDLMVQNGEDLMMIFYMIVRQFRLLVQIKYLKDRNFPKDAIQKKIKLAPFQIGALLQQAESFSFKSLKMAYSRLAEMEYGIKTGRTPTGADQIHLLHLRLDQFLCTLYE